MSATGLFRWLILLALLCAPLAMIGGSPSAAHAMPMAAGSCSDEQGPVEAPPSAPVDCMVACAGCLPLQPGPLADRPRLEPAVRSEAIPFLLRGLHPEAETPPPRSS